MEEYLWFKSYDAGMPHTLEPYPQKTLVDCFYDSLRQRPDNPMVLFQGTSVSYKEVERFSNAVAAGLIAQGVKKGDRVSMLLPNCPQVVFCHLGIWKTGAIASPINPLYTKSELERSFNECGAEVVICLTPFYKMVKEIQPKTRIRLVITANIKDFLPWHMRMLFTLLREKQQGHRIRIKQGDLKLEDMVRQFRNAERPAISVQPDDHALLLFSGGTTGTTEAAVGLHRGLVAAGMQLSTWFAPLLVPWDDVIMAPVPMFHVFGNVALMATSIVNHNTMSLVPNPRDLNDMVKAIKRDKPAFIPGVPTLFLALLNHPDVKSGKVNIKSVKLCVAGGSALLAEIKHRFEAVTGGKMVEGYALTESMLGCVATPVMGKYKEGAVGCPLPDVIIRIVDTETGTRVLEAGQSGEIIMKAPQIMQGYWQRPRETAGMIRDGWLYTGDVGYLDEDGYLYIQSRKKEVIKCGGFQVWPRQVEEVLTSHPAVTDVIVAGIPDPYQGEAVKAWVVLDGIPCTAQELRDYCRDKLTGYKVPRYIEFRDALPKSAVGKHLSRILIEEELAKSEQIKHS